MLGRILYECHIPELINSTCCFLFLNFQFAGPPVVEAVLEPLEAAVTHQRVGGHPEDLGAGAGGLQGAQAIITGMGDTLK